MVGVLVAEAMEAVSVAAAAAVMVVAAVMAVADTGNTRWPSLADHRRVAQRRFNRLKSQTLIKSRRSAGASLTPSPLIPGTSRRR